jgi:hypothetical protein
MNAILDTVEEILAGTSSDLEVIDIPDYLPRMDGQGGSGTGC